MLAGKWLVRRCLKDLQGEGELCLQLNVRRHRKNEGDRWWGDCEIGVFFFQAEDGIRDDLVTGVQTCALPISSRSSLPPASSSRDDGRCCWRVAGELHDVGVGAAHGADPALLLEDLEVAHGVGERDRKSVV